MAAKGLCLKQAKNTTSGDVAQLPVVIKGITLPQKWRGGGLALSLVASQCLAPWAGGNRRVTHPRTDTCCDVTRAQLNPRHRRRKIVVHQWRTCCYDSVSMEASSYEQTCCLKTSMYVSQWSDLLGMVCCVQTPCIYTIAWIDVFVVFLSKLDNYKSNSQFHAVLLYQTHADECAADSQGLSTWKFQHSGWSRFNVIINILKSK